MIRAMSTRYPMTEEGLDTLRKELYQLKTTERPKISRAIAQARELGDLSENAEYHAAREKQSFLETRIKYLEDRVAGAQIIAVDSLSCDSVKFGARVRLLDKKSKSQRVYRIVGAAEADLEQGLISVDSPLSKALIGARQGDEVTVSVPSGEKVYTIADISYGEGAKSQEKKT